MSRDKSVELPHKHTRRKHLSDKSNAPIPRLWLTLSQLCEHKTFPLERYLLGGTGRLLERLGEPHR